MEDWLFNILKNNTLVDNQTYTANNGVFSNHRLKDSILLKERIGSQWKNNENDNQAVYHFLVKTSIEINKRLQQKDQNTLVLFNKGEYEHNSSDNFVEISGIDSRDFKLITGNIIGYVKNGNHALKISSRFGDTFLKHIISEADGFIEFENYGGQNSEEGYEWLLIYLWKIKLKKAFRLGVPKLYKSETQHLNRVRGKIDPVSYFLNQNSGKYLCNYREHHYDTEAAKLVTEVFLKLKNETLLSDIHPLKTAFITATKGVRTKPINLYNTSHFSNPFYHEYNEVIDLSKLILRNELRDFGEKSDNSAFFFDISMLFEYYVRKLLINNGHLLHNKFEKRMEISTGTFNKYRRKIEPDIVLQKQDGVLVFDVKYKAFDFIYGVKREDLFQLHTYIGQYSNEHNVKSCGFIYPITEEKWNRNKGENNSACIKESILISGKPIPFYVFFIVVPTQSNDKAFREQFNKYNSNFLELISEL